MKAPPDGLPGASEVRLQRADKPLGSKPELGQLFASWASITRLNSEKGLAPERK